MKYFKYLILLIAVSAATYVAVANFNFGDETSLADNLNKLNEQPPVDAVSNKKLLDDNPSVEQKKLIVETPKAVSKSADINEKSASTQNNQKGVLIKMPFISQAPLGNWSDLRQEDGCEEASALMAVRWARGEGPLDKITAEKELLEISDFEQQQYGGFEDTSIADTLTRIIQGYFDFQQASVKENINLADIKDALSQGYLVITPMDGQALHNPNYTAPGPDRHMLVVRGYDPVNKEIITNDPGTRRGELYRYPEDVFFAAIRDYPTGNHAQIIGNKKNMIIVKPEINAIE